MTARFSAEGIATPLDCPTPILRACGPA